MWPEGASILILQRYYLKEHNTLSSQSNSDGSSCLQVITTEGESDFSTADMVETSYTLTEYEKAKADMFGRSVAPQSSLYFVGYLDDVASDVRAKSSFCGFTDIVGGGVVGFDRVSADSNVDGASIDGGSGVVTVGAEASYQVNRMLLTGLLEIFHYIYR